MPFGLAVMAMVWFTQSWRVRAEKTAVAVRSWDDPFRKAFGKANPEFVCLAWCLLIFGAFLPPPRGC